MTLEWKYSNDAVDWEELSALYRAAPLGDKKAAHLQKVFANSMFKCFVYDDSKLVAAGRALADGGRVLMVEPSAADCVEDNFNPLGRFGYGISTLVCTPCSISDGGPGIGAQAGERRTGAIFSQAGFGTFRRAAETPLNIVYEARP